MESVLIVHVDHPTLPILLRPLHPDERLKVDRVPGPQVGSIPAYRLGELSSLRLPYDLFFDAMPPPHLEFLQSLRHYHRTPDAVCVHGGLDPDLGPVESQPPDPLVWGTDAFQYRYAGEPVVVYGHWDHTLNYPNGRAEPVVIGRTIGMDSFKHGTLTALKMPDGVVMQSNGADTWVYSSTDIRAQCIAASERRDAQGGLPSQRPAGHRS